jgi:hypothetical protein
VTRWGAIDQIPPSRAQVAPRGIRLDEHLIARVERAAKEEGFSNPSAEERIAAASLDRLGREIRSIKLAQQGLFAFVDSLVKILLTMAGDSEAAMVELLNHAEKS